MRILKKIAVIALGIPCVYSAEFLLLANSVHGQSANGMTSGKRGVTQDSGCSPTPSPSPGN